MLIFKVNGRNHKVFNSNERKIVILVLLNVYKVIYLNKKHFRKYIIIITVIFFVLSNQPAQLMASPTNPEHSFHPLTAVTNASVSLVTLSVHRMSALRRVQVSNTLKLLNIAVKPVLSSQL